MPVFFWQNEATTARRHVFLWRESQIGRNLGRHQPHLRSIIVSIIVGLFERQEASLLDCLTLTSIELLFQH
jgi:hypothetical protein